MHKLSGEHGANFKEFTLRSEMGIMEQKILKNFTKCLLIVHTVSWYGRPIPLWMTNNILGHPSFMFVVHIPLFSFLKIALNVLGLGQLLWTKITCYGSLSIIIMVMIFKSANFHQLCLKVIVVLSSYIFFASLSFIKDISKFHNFYLFILIVHYNS